MPFPEELSQTSWISGHALNFLAEADRDRPIFAHVNYVQPHAPSCPPAEYVDRIDRSAIPRPVLPEWQDDPLAPHCFAQNGLHIDPVAWRDRRHLYLADVAHLDHQLGLLLDALEASGQWNETVLFFLSDHGDLLYDHGFFGKGERHYDACIRIPLIVAGAGIRQGHECAALVQHEDIVPTVLELAGLPQPQVPVGGPHSFDVADPSLPGRSLVPWCRGEELMGWRDAVYVESYNNIDSRTPMNWARTVRTEEWRYTLYPGEAGEQLFHICEDIDETRNLAGETGHAETRAALRGPSLRRAGTSGLSASAARPDCPGCPLMGIAGS